MRYQLRRPSPRYDYPDELMTVKVRYKHPERATSELMERPVSIEPGEARHLPFAAAVAEFGILLREPQPWPDRWASLADRLRGMRLSADREGVIELVESARALKRLR